MIHPSPFIFQSTSFAFHFPSSMWKCSLFLLLSAHFIFICIACNSQQCKYANDWTKHEEEKKYTDKSKTSRQINKVITIQTSCTAATSQWSFFFFVRSFTKMFLAISNFVAFIIVYFLWKEFVWSDKAATKRGSNSLGFFVGGEDAMIKFCCIGIRQILQYKIQLIFTADWLQRKSQIFLSFSHQREICAFHGNLCGIYWILNWYGACLLVDILLRECRQQKRQQCKQSISCWASFWLVSHFRFVLYLPVSKRSFESNIFSSSGDRSQDVIRFALHA